MPDTCSSKKAHIWIENNLRNEKITTARVERQRETEKELCYVIIGLRPSAAVKEKKTDRDWRNVWVNWETFSGLNENISTIARYARNFELTSMKILSYWKWNWKTNFVETLTLLKVLN